ncbi:hypothetical protein L3Q82_016930, partial [Scortum barcoo]
MATRPSSRTELARSRAAPTSEIGGGFQGRGEGLTFSEFLTVLKLAANLAIERPIDARVQSREDRIEYITPNTMLLGRATQSGDFKTFDYTTYPFKR